MSANSLTKSVVTFLNYNGFVAWNVYNGGVYDPKRQTYRKNPTQKHGVFDVCGFRKSDGRHLEIEIKFGRDKMSSDQMDHFDDLKKAGAIAYVCRTFDEFEHWFNELKSGGGSPTKEKPNNGFGASV
jgi:hypothetical protein